MSSKRGQGGFSLLEGLVAVAISSLGLVGVYAMVNSTSARLDNVSQRQALQSMVREMVGVLESNSADLSGFSQSLSDCATLATRIGTALSDDNKALMVNWCQRLDAELGVANAQSTRAISVGTVARADGVSFRVVNLELTDAQGQTRVALKRVFRETQ